MNKYLDFINYNLSMLTDRVRIESYRRALRQIVRPGNVVVDIGCGSGILAFLACQAGAKRVYAIEAEDVIDLAKQVSSKNGLQDRIVFMKQWSFQAELPERADVLVTETMGTFGLDEGLVGAVIDGRDRMLKEGGRLVPRALRLFAVPIELPGFYEHMVDFWNTHCQGVDLSPVRYFAANSFHPIKVHEEAFLSSPAMLAEVVLASAKGSEISARLSFYAKRRGRCHGFAGWFEADLCDGVSVSNAPSNAASHWGVAFFPIAQPVVVHSGARVVLEMQSLSNGTRWQWQADVGGLKFRQETPCGFQQAPEEPAVIGDSSSR